MTEYYPFFTHTQSRGTLHSLTLTHINTHTFTHTDTHTQTHTHTPHTHTHTHSYTQGNGGYQGFLLPMKTYCEL